MGFPALEASPSRLFKPLRIGNVILEHRVVMAPMTRGRADDDGVQLPLATVYYEQRASVPGTLIISEATFISPCAAGHPNIPGIWSAAQIEAWRKITDAVHKRKSFIFCQLWSVGRTANPQYAKSKGIEIISSSPVPLDASRPIPKEMTYEDIHKHVADFAQAAHNAIDAGFDGVELHGAHGYLIDQFIQDTVNHRCDKYGGDQEKRSRFALEVAEAVANAVGAERLGFRLSPFSKFQGMGMSNPISQFKSLLEGLKGMRPAYIHLIEARVHGAIDIEATENLDFAIDTWANTSPVLISGGYNIELAKKAMDEEYKDRDIAISFGRHFLSTPDLPFRVRYGLKFNSYDRNTFYTGNAEAGYTDYPFSKEFNGAGFE